jgi:hypothetical protein
MANRAQVRKGPSQPRKRPARENQAITRLEPKYLRWSGLADVIVERAMIEEQAQSYPPEKAQSYPPEKAKKLRASAAAVRLEQQERQLWKDLCAAAALGSKSRGAVVRLRP